MIAQSFEELVEQGVYEIAGFAEDGETLWSLNMTEAERKAPDLFWGELNAIDLAVLDAVDKGWMELDFSPDTMEIDYVVTEKGMQECVASGSV